MTFRYSPGFFRSLIFDDVLNLQLCGLANDENCVELVGEFYERGLHVLSSDDDDDDPDDLVLQPIFRSWYGTLLLRATSDDGKAIETLERALKDFEAVNVTGNVRFIRDCAENELQMRYLCKALRARSSGDSSGADDFASRLSDIFHRGNSCNNTRQSTMVLAVWERTEKREDVVKKLIQPAIAVAIDMLTDDNDENDLQAWDRLSCALAASGDALNATAAAFFAKQFKGMVKRREDVIPKPAVEEPGLEEAVSEHSNAEEAVFEEGLAQITGSEGTDKDSKRRTTSYYWCTCDGCFERLSISRIQYRCSNCLSVDFCAFCHQLLLGGELKQNICDRSHEFLRIPAVTGALPEGKIRVNNQDIAIKDWLDGLKRQWDL
jgi:hypothetical protein